MPLQNVVPVGASCESEDFGALAAVGSLVGSAARVGAASKPSASTAVAAHAACDRQLRNRDNSVVILIKLNIGMVPTNLSRMLGCPGCRAMLQPYRMGVCVLGKIDPMCGPFTTPAHI